MKRISLRNLGPIRDCNMEVNQFTILTGAQASGKSTLAKAIYFFRTIKDDVFEQITHRPTEDDYYDGLEKGLTKRLRNKFLRIFGSSWSMSSNMKMVYEYKNHMKIEVWLEPDNRASYRNFIKFEFGDALYELFKKYEHEDYIWDQDLARKSLRDEITTVFEDDYEIVYIPAGRSLITVLTDRLASMIDDDNRTLDYCMRSYIRLTLALRSAFREGTEGLLRVKIQTTQDKVDRNTLKLLQSMMDLVLQGQYRYQMGEERLNLLGKDRNRYVKINFASSGQQETTWVFNLLYYYLLERRKVFMIIEEPEAHLFPEAQKVLAEALALFGHERNQVLVTTHSPYILGAYNNLLYAGSIQNHETMSLPFPRETLLNPKATAVWHVDKGLLQNGLSEGLVQNELIDGASNSINRDFDALLELDPEYEVANE